MDGLLAILPIMIAAGILGAGASTALNKDERNWEALKWNCVIGVSASFLIPVLLTTVSSEVLHNLTVQTPLPTFDKYLVFAGYCLLGAISAQRLITTLSEKVLQIAKSAEKAAHDAKAEALEIKASAEQTKLVALATTDAIQYGIKEPPMEMAAPAAVAHLDRAIIEEALKSDDPWKVQIWRKSWSEQSKVTGRNHSISRHAELGRDFDQSHINGCATSAHRHGKLFYSSQFS